MILLSHGSEKMPKLLFSLLRLLKGPGSDLAALFVTLKLSLVLFPDRLFGLAGQKIELHSRPEKTEVSKNRMGIGLCVPVSCLVN